MADGPRDFSVLWADDHLLVVNKPAGLLTIRDGYHPELPFLANLLEAEYGRVWVVHRLDKDTSGVILFARSAADHRTLNQQFERREIQKTYHALVMGMPEWESLNIALPLRPNGDRRHRTVIDHQAGKPAHTTVEVVRRLGVFTLLAASPHTGYTHQIRAHLAAMGFPLLADPIYQTLQLETQALLQARQIAASLPINRTALHAAAITFTHPAAGLAQTIQAPYPSDFEQSLAALEQKYG